ncbi:MAG: AAA family ATPase, partial [Thermodesulfobacteriota bacterium]
MISLIEALNYRCLRYISQPLRSFHVLVGPNASGKTTFLDVVHFLGRFVSGGLEASFFEAFVDYRNFFWMGRSDRFE